MDFSNERTSPLLPPPAPRQAGSSSDVGTEVTGVLVRSNRPSSGRSLSRLAVEVVRPGFELAASPQSCCGFDVFCTCIAPAAELPPAPPRPPSPAPSTFSAGPEANTLRTLPSRNPVSDVRPQLPAAGSGITAEPLTRCPRAKPTTKTRKKSRAGERDRVGAPQEPSTADGYLRSEMPKCAGVVPLP